MLINPLIPFTGKKPLKASIKSYVDPDALNDPWKPQVNEGDKRAAFFYINDMHCITDKMPFIKSFSNRFDEKYKDITTFKVSGGDMKAGTGMAFNNIAIDFMNSIGIEFSALGNHETDCGLDAFAQQLSRLDTKFISSNLNVKEISALNTFFAPFEEFKVTNNKLKGSIEKNHKKIFNSCIVEKNGEKYGFIGLSTPYTREYRQELEGVSILNPFTVYEDIKQLKGQLSQIRNELKPIPEENYKKLKAELNENLKQQRNTHGKMNSQIEDPDHESLDKMIKEMEQRKTRIKAILKKIEPPTDIKTKKLLEIKTKLSQLNKQNLIQNQINKLRDKGINKIILLSHLGSIKDKGLVPELDGVDIVIEGHDHALTPAPVKLRSKSDEPVLMVQAGQDGRYTGILDVVFNSKGIITDFNNNIYSSGDTVFKENSISEIWDKYLKKPERLASIKKTFYPGTRKKEENTFANLCAEALLAYDQKNSKNPAEIAFIVNAGKINNKTLKKEINDRDIINIDEWGDRIYKTQFTGQQIIEIMNMAARQGFSRKGAAGLLHSSNVYYTVNSEEKDGIKKLSIGDVKLLTPERVINSDMYTKTDSSDYEPIEKDKKYNVIFDEMFLNNIGQTQDEYKDFDAGQFGPINEGIDNFRKTLRRIEKTGDAPKGHEFTEVCKWGRADAVIDYIKTLHSHKLENSETMLDKKLKDNKKISIKFESPVSGIPIIR